MLPSTDLYTHAAHPQDEQHGGITPLNQHRMLLRWIAGASCVLGIVIACIATNPDTLSTLSTAQLLGIIVLIVGPALTLFALRLETRTAAQPVDTDGCTDEDVSLRVKIHEAHDRSTRVHVRVEEAHETPRVHEPAA